VPALRDNPWDRATSRIQGSSEAQPVPCRGRPRGPDWQRAGGSRRAARSGQDRDPFASAAEPIGSGPIDLDVPPWRRRMAKTCWCPGWIKRRRWSISRCRARPHPAGTRGRPTGGRTV